MIRKRLISFVSALALVLSLFTLLPEGEKLFTLSAEAADTNDITKYSYTVTPLLAPFNNYFFVKTDNPDPTSFRFADKSSKYSEDAYIAAQYDLYGRNLVTYEDVKYSDITTGRVNGGYIFEGTYTDGGQLVLQSVVYEDYSREMKVKDTSTKITIPGLKSSFDYLMDTYATKTDFFDNMDAVEKGLSSICLYSGSYIKGELYKALDYWGMSTSPYADQSYYIQSPYRRKENKSLFASVLYPYKYDSVSFPGVMSAVAMALDSNAEIEFDLYNHAFFEVTHNGITKRYGGAGNGIGQGITKDKISHYFTFGSADLKMTLASAKKRLDDYSKLEIPSDIPEEGRLHWADVWNTVGKGAWVRLNGSGGEFDIKRTSFSFLYQQGDGTDFSSEKQSFDNGTELYMGSDLGYYSDVWLDGRYIGIYETWDIGAVFDDHPTSSVIFSNMSIPVISVDIEMNFNLESYKWEYTYKNVRVTEKNREAFFDYNYNTNEWEMQRDCFNADPDDHTLTIGGSGNWGIDPSVFHSIVDNISLSISDVKEFVKQGLVDKSVLDRLTLTNDEMKALGPDKNTNMVPRQGYIYDRSAAPGTPFTYLFGDINLDGTVDRIDANLLSRYVAGWDGYEDKIYLEFADLNGDGDINRIDANILSRCVADWDGYRAQYIK